MSQTLSVERDDNRTPTMAVELVYSPDDGGYYLSAVDFAKNKNRTSKAIYRTESAARQAWQAGKVRWESWY